MDQLRIVELERKRTPKSVRAARLSASRIVQLGIIHIRQCTWTVGARWNRQRLLPGMHEVEAMPQFMHVAVKLQAFFIGSGAGESGIEAGTSLPLMRIGVVEHNAQQVGAKLVQLRS